MDRLERACLLYLVTPKFCEINLHPGPGRPRRGCAGADPGEALVDDVRAVLGEFIQRAHYGVAAV